MNFILAVSQSAAAPLSRIMFLVALLIIMAAAGKLFPELLGGRRRGNRSDGRKDRQGLPSKVENVYKARRYLFSNAERSFYEVLRCVVEPKCRLFAKVRLADLITVPKGSSNWQAHFNRVQSKHVDYVICDLAALRVLAVVELDDSSHSATDRQERDAFLDSVLDQCGIPIFRVKASIGYVPSDIRELLTKILGIAECEAAA